MSFLSGFYVGNDMTDLFAANAWLGTNSGVVGVHTGKASWTDWTGSVNYMISQTKAVSATRAWSIPMFADSGNLQDAAAGKYDSYYVQAAKSLIAAYGASSTILVRVGEEFNGTWFKWSAGSDPASYVKAYQHFVDAFRSVAGNFKFEWNVNNGSGTAASVAAAYPGDKYVDYIGMDFYWDSKQTWSITDPTKAFAYIRDNPTGLAWLENFAAAHGKQTAYSEWGVNSSNASTYIALVKQWFDSHNVAYEMYWNSDSAFAGKLSDGSYGATSAEFKALFGAVTASATTPATVTTTTPATVTTTTPATVTTTTPVVTTPATVTTTPVVTTPATDTITAVATNTAAAAGTTAADATTSAAAAGAASGNSTANAEQSVPAVLATAVAVIPLVTRAATGPVASGSALSGPTATGSAASPAAARAAIAFDPLLYAASNTDIALAFGTDVARITMHYQTFGIHEGRSWMTFDALIYAASNPDLAHVFGTDIDALATHYIVYGMKEGRSVSSFDALEYAASNMDLARAFGTNVDALAAHYINYGMAEGRHVSSFDALEYAASNPDLARAFGTNVDALAAHYIIYGMNEGRSLTTFDAVEYAASNPDLARAFGTNVDELAAHYIAYGMNEGRQVASFDALEYAASNTDLAKVYGTNVDALAAHYVAYGMNEGRQVASFDVAAYEAANPDIAATLGNDRNAVLSEYINEGLYESRPLSSAAAANAVFDLGTHILVGTAASETLFAGSSDATLTGGGGADRFAFGTASVHDVVKDFGNGADMIDATALVQSGYAHTLAQVGSDTVISFANGANITLLGVSTAHVTDNGLGHFGYI